MTVKRYYPQESITLISEDKKSVLVCAPKVLSTEDNSGLVLYTDYESLEKANKELLEVLGKSYNEIRSYTNGLADRKTAGILKDIEQAIAKDKGNKAREVLKATNKRV